MTKVLVEESSLSGIADAIREKTGETATYKPREMAAAISKITGGGKAKFGLSIDNVIGDVNADGALSAPEPADVVLSGVTGVAAGSFRYFNAAKSFSAPDLVTVTNDNAMAYAFAGSGKLVSAEFSALENVTASEGFSYAFNYANSLQNVGFPKLRVVNGGRAFSYVLEGASALVSADFSSLERVYGGNAFYMAFHGCAALKEISFPSLLVVNGSAALSELFYSCARLESVLFPSLEVITGSYVFRYVFDGCRKLHSVEFPALATIDCNSTSAFSGGQFQVATAGSSITTMRFPKLKGIYANGTSTSDGPFSGCTVMTRIDLPALTTIGTHYTGSGAVSDVAIKNMFYGCSSLKEIHFGSANQAAVEAMPGYDTLWGLGAGKATVYFDL